METGKAALPPTVKWAIGLLLVCAAPELLGLATHFWPLSLLSMELLLDVAIDLALAGGLATRQVWSWGGTLIWASYLTAEEIVSGARLLAGGGPFQLGSLSAQGQLLLGGRFLIELAASATVVLLLLTPPVRRTFGVERKAEQPDERESIAGETSAPGGST
ncbi:MAG: hypothetical protein E6G66_01290 [Actinobacteria bacterium]|nr:MAG: hypothetical protein E6G66_01290 [Actinomycetota bacterium]